MIRILFSAGTENTLVDRIVDDGHKHTDDTDDNAGNHSIGHANCGADVGHHKAHTAAHDDGADGAENVCEHICRTLYLGVKLPESIEVSVLLFRCSGRVKLAT